MWIVSPLPIFFILLVLVLGAWFFFVVDAGDADKDDGNLPLAYLQFHIHVP